MAIAFRPAVLACAAIVATGFVQTSWPVFEPVQPDLLAAGGTLVNAFADIDLDDDPDLFVGFNGEPNRLYRNDKGVLVDVAAELGVADARPTRAAAWGDFDGDGDADLLVGFAPGDASVLKLYRNDRTGFADVTRAAGLMRDGGAVRQPVWVDFDADGDLDLFVAFRDGPNAMFRNTGGRFEDVAAVVGLDDTRRSVGAVWFDADDDGDLDLYVGNMDGDANGLFMNPRLGPGGAVTSTRFEDRGPAMGLEWGGRAPGEPSNGTVRPCAADVDGDGRLDLFMANYGPNGLFLNAGRGRWTNASAPWGIAIDGRYDSCAFADADHDGRLDLYVNGTFTGGRQYPDFLFRNAGQRFEAVTPETMKSLNADHGAAWADIDGDGDLDLALTGARPDGTHVVLRNLLDPERAARSLQVRIDAPGHRGLPGAVVRVSEPGTNRPLQTRLMDAGSGYNTQHDLPVHFGLPDGGGVVEVTAWFPAARGATSTSIRVDPAEWRGRVLVLRPGARSGDRMTVR
jgi:hypothetical protein